jgi:predicted nucleic-acid-binding protein
MQGLDTNVLVRVLLRDDRRQARAAEAAINRALAAGEPLVVSLLTVLETEWVLRTRGGLDKSTVIRTFKSLLEARDLLIEDEEVLEQALYTFEDGSADFADCLMLARYLRFGCSSMLTFDSRAAKLAGAEQLRV